MLWRFGHPPADIAPSAHQLLLAWWREVWTGMLVFGWRQPFRSRSVPDSADMTLHSGRRGVVLVHGFVCNRGLWTTWMRTFRQTGVPFVAVNLEPVFCPIESYAPIIDAAVRRLQQATGLRPIVVAHSMGGLAVRAWLTQPDSHLRMHRVITIATPHGGTWLARFGLTANSRQMRLGSRWIAELERGESASLRARFTCFYGHCDNVVFPVATATLPGADNRHLPSVAHVDMLSHPAVFKAVMQFLCLDDDAGFKRPDR